MISLKYGTFAGTMLNWSASQDFKELKFIEKPVNNRLSGTSLREICYTHTLSKKKLYELVISADELISDAKMSFVENFFNADAWKFSLDNWASETEATLAEERNFPVEFINGNKNLPEISFLMISKYPV